MFGNAKCCSGNSCTLNVMRCCSMDGLNSSNARMYSGVFTLDNPNVFKNASMFSRVPNDGSS